MKKLQLYFLMGILSWLFNGCSNEKKPTTTKSKAMMAEQITIEGLENALIELKNGDTDFHFIGITSNGTDCIYFIYEKEKFNIEFEAMGEDQLPYIEKLTSFAKSNNFKSVSTTYNNKPEYKSNEPAPVLRIETNTSLEETVKLGKKIQAEIFYNNDYTIYDVVP